MESATNTTPAAPRQRCYRCLRPTTVTLTGKITVVAPGTAVKQINENLFPPAR